MLTSSDATVEDPEIHVPSVDTGDASIRYFIYQPPLGIMEHSKPMSAGSYRFQFNPASNFEKACVEGRTDLAATDYKFTVDTMELYVCEESMNTDPTGTDTLNLVEHHVQSKRLDQASSVDFTVPVSTQAISIFVQSGLAGVDNRFPPSKFTTENGSHKKLRQLQLTYANQTKPPTSWQSESGPRTMKLQQRYFDTQVESGQAFSSGGCQSLSDWLLDGPVYHYTFQRDSNDRSSQLQLSMHFEGPLAANDNVFVVSHFKREIMIEVEAGYISQVTALTI
jgi:hypothetical protein